MKTPPSAPPRDRTHAGPERPTVLHLVPRFQNDGTMNMVRALLKSLDQGRYRLILCALNGGNMPAEWIAQFGVDVRILDMRHFLDLRVLRKLFRIMRAEKVRIVHTHRARPDCYGWLAAWLAGVPTTISTQHYVGEWRERGPIVWMLIRIFFRLARGLCDRFVAISRAEKDCLAAAAKYPERQMCVIHNGIELDRFRTSAEPGEQAARRAQYGIPPDHRLVGTVGSLLPRKGVHHLIACAPRVLQASPKTMFLMVGGGPQEAALKQLARDVGVERHVVFTGDVKNVPEWMGLLDVFCHCAAWEPFGLVVAEAMACAKPVVGFSIGALPEIVRVGESGLLVPAGDQEALGRAIIDLLNDPERCRTMGRAGRQIAEQAFASERMAAEYARLYDAYLDHPS